MNIVKEIDLANKLVKEENYIYEMLVDYLADRKIYHTIAILIFSKVYNVDNDFSKDFIYSNEFYSNFKNEENPFNDDFIGYKNG